MHSKAKTTVRIDDGRKSFGRTRARPAAAVKPEVEEANYDIPLYGDLSSLMLLVPNFSACDLLNKETESEEPLLALLQRKWKAKPSGKSVAERLKPVMCQDSRYQKGRKSIVPVDQVIRRALLEESYTEEDAEDLPKVEPVQASVLGGRCQEILTAKRLINKRLGRLIGRWATHNHYESYDDLDNEGDDKGSSKKWRRRANDTKRQNDSTTCLVASNTGHFPTGLGFFLCPETCFSYEKEPELHWLYDTIMLLDDQKTQDYLLSFLHDFTLQRSIYGTVQQQRCDLLKHVRKWMRSCYEETFDTGIKFEKAFSAAMEAEKAFRECTQRFSDNLEMLTFLHKIMRYSSMVTPETELAMEQELKASVTALAILQQDTPNEDDITKRCKSAIVEFFRAVKDKRKQESKLMVNCLEVTLKSVTQASINIQNDSTTVQQSIIRAQEAILQVKKTTTDLATQKQKLTEKLQQLETEAASKDFSGQMNAEASLPKRKQLKKIRTVDAATQTTEMSKGGKSRKLRQKLEDATSYDSNKSGKSQESGKSLKNMEANKPSSKHLGKKNKTKKAKVALADAEQEAKKKTVEENSQEIISEENPKVLVTMLRRFNIVNMKSVHRLRLTLEVLKQIAETDTERTLERESKVRHLIEKIRPVQCSVSKQVANFPVLSVDKQDMRMRSRAPPDHKCRLCFCHQFSPKYAVTIGSSRAGRTAVENLLSHCQTYATLLDSVKARYQDISRCLSAALELAPQKPTFLFQRGSYMDRESADAAKECLDLEKAEAVLEVELFPDASLEDSLPRAAKVSTLLSDLIWRNREAVCNAQACLNDMEDQETKLDKIEQELNKAQELLETSSLQVAQKRVGNDFLQTGKLLRDCLCPHCRCYNSPFDDHLRNFSTMSSVPKQLQHCLSWTISLIKQGLNAVQFRLKQDQSQSMDFLDNILNPDFSYRRNNVFNVKPAVVSLLARSTAMVSGAIDFVGGPVPISPSDSLCALARFSFSGLSLTSFDLTPRNSLTSTD